MDVLSASLIDDRVAWYENIAGQRIGLAHAHDHGRGRRGVVGRRRRTWTATATSTSSPLPPRRAGRLVREHGGRRQRLDRHGRSPPARPMAHVRLRGRRGWRRRPGRAVRVAGRRQGRLVREHAGQRVGLGDAHDLDHAPTASRTVVAADVDGDGDRDAHRDRTGRLTSPGTRTRRATARPGSVAHRSRRCRTPRRWPPGTSTATATSMR